MIATYNNGQEGTAITSCTPQEWLHVVAGLSLDADERRLEQRRREHEALAYIKRILPADAARPIVAASQCQGPTAEAAAAIALKRGLK